MDEVIEAGWGDTLTEEGIFAHGYGAVPKFVMLDPSLRLPAKSIYALLCSYAGNGETAFPSRDTIVSRLGLNKDTYYKYFNELLESGYITVERTAPNRRDCGFMHNVYRIESRPPRFTASPGYQAEGSTLSLGGIKGAGYGLIARSVMDSSAISCKAKGLYAVLASFTGGGKSAFPSIAALTYYTGISRNTYQKLIRELIDANLVEVVQRNNGRMGVNDYYLVERPRPGASGGAARGRGGGVNSSDIRNWDVCAGSPGTRAAPRAAPVKSSDIRFSDLQNPYMQEPDTVKPDVCSSDAINNSTAINSSANNSSSINSHDNQQRDLCGMIDSMGYREKVEFVRDAMGYDMVLANYASDRDCYDSLIEIVVDTISAPVPMLRIGGVMRSREEVAERLLALDVEHYRYALNMVSQTEGKIRNIRAYYVSCLFNASAEASLALKKEVENDCRSGQY